MNTAQVLAEVSAGISLLSFVNKVFIKDRWPRLNATVSAVIGAVPAADLVKVIDELASAFSSSGNAALASKRLRANKTLAACQKRSG